MDLLKTGGVDCFVFFVVGGEAGGDDPSSFSRFVPLRAGTLTFRFLLLTGIPLFLWPANWSNVSVVN